MMMARALALNGASKVYILGRRKEALESVSKSVSTSNIIPIVCDVTSKSSLDAAISTITTETGYINLLVANSGMLGPQPTEKLTSESTIKDFVKAYNETSSAEYEKTFELNTTAVWYTIVGFLELLDEGNKKGNVVQKSQIVATSSIASFNRNTPGGFAYGQSKAAVTHMVKQLATRLAQWGIRVNAIAPGRKLYFYLIIEFDYLFLPLQASPTSKTNCTLQKEISCFIKSRNISDKQKSFPQTSQLVLSGRASFPELPFRLKG